MTPSPLPAVGMRLRFVRSAEDYGDLDGVPMARREGLGRVKAVPLGAGGPILSVGGDYRLRIDGFDDPGYAIAGVPGFAAYQHRVYLHGDLRFAETARVFGELSYLRERGREPGPRPFDETDPDVQQLFVDLPEPGGPTGVAVRLGRQELPLGSTRLFALRDGPNARRTFDAAKLDLALGVMDLTTFYAQLVSIHEGGFDDRSGSEEQAWGAYATFAVSEAVSLDGYYLGRRRDGRLWSQGVADERRHTVGVRVWGASGGLDYDVEGAYQFGSFGEGDISAWGIGTLVGYTLAEAPLAPRLGLRANLASGDRGGDDPDLETFDALYPNLSYFTDAAIYAPANAVDLRPFVELDLSETVTATLGADAIWRLRGTDAIYAAGYVPLVPAGTRGSGPVTVLLDASASWSPTPFVTIEAAYVHGTAGELVRGAGGGDFDYGFLEASMRF